MTSCEPTRCSAYREDLRWRIVWQTDYTSELCPAKKSSFYYIAMEFTRMRVALSINKGARTVCISCTWGARQAGQGGSSPTPPPPPPKKKKIANSEFSTSDDELKEHTSYFFSLSFLWSREIIWLSCREMPELGMVSLCLLLEILYPFRTCYKRYS